MTITGGAGKRENKFLLRNICFLLVLLLFSLIAADAMSGGQVMRIQAGQSAAGSFSDVSSGFTNDEWTLRVRLMSSAALNLLSLEQPFVSGWPGRPADIRRLCRFQYLMIALQILMCFYLIVRWNLEQDGKK